MTVTDQSTGTPSAPTGSVTFESSPSTGGFSGSASCAPVAVSADSAACTVAFTAGKGGDYTVSAEFGGDAAHSSSGGSYAVTVIDPTSTSVSCVTASFPVDTEVTCTATLSDSGSPRQPTGQVTFSASGSGTQIVASPSACPWTPGSGGAGGSATCQFSFSAATAGSYTLTAAYGGDGTHAASSANTQVSVTNTPIGGGPGAADPGGVTLPLPAGAGEPTGTVPDPGKIRIARATASVSKHRVAGVWLACSGERTASCSGILALTTKIRVKVTVREVLRRRHGKRSRTRLVTKTQTRLLEIGTVTYTVRARARKQISLHLTKRGARLLARARHHRLRARASAAGVVRNVVLVPTRKHKRHRRKPTHKHKHAL